MRQHPFTNGEVYHLMNKSIAGYEIFKYDSDYAYFLDALWYFTLCDQPNKFSYFRSRDPIVQQENFSTAMSGLISQTGQLVEIIAFCLMPTHFHVIARQLENNGITTLIRHTLNTYTRYFNIKHQRKGPLWVGPFKSVLIHTDEQLLHTIRYSHLNPTSAGLVSKPEDWAYSSYCEYISPEDIDHALTTHKQLFDLAPLEHKAFTEDHQDYQRNLALIKNIILE